MHTMYTNALVQKTKTFLLSSTVIVTTGILIGSFFSYVLQFLLGRMLSISDYGTFNALLSLTYLVSVPAGVFGTSIIKVTAELLAKKRFDKLTTLFWKLNLYSLIAGFVLFIIIYFLRNQIATYLNISEVSLLLPFGIFLGLSYLNVIPGSYLQGLLRFKAFAFYIGATALLRLIIPITVLYLGYNIGGVFYGFSAVMVLSVILSYFLLRKNLSDFEDLDLSDNYKRIMTFSFSVLFINFGLMALNNLDMLMVKRFFDPTVAGYYAGTVTLGKIFLFGAGTVATVMFPQMSNLYAKQSKLLYPRFKKFFSIQLTLVLLGLLAFFIFPKLLTLLFFGDRFIHSVELLPRFSVFIALYILINFIVLFFMAIERTKVVLFLIPTIIVQYLLFLYYNESVEMIININILVSSLLLSALTIYFLRIRKRITF